MKLNITKNEYDQERHKGEVFPGAQERRFAYQGETASHARLVLDAWPPSRRDGKLNWDLENSEYSHYTLEISGSGKHVEVKLVGHRQDTVAQRIRIGFATTSDFLIRSMSFGEFCNLIFSGETFVYHDRESFPDSVKRTMQLAYPPSPDRGVSDFQI